VAYLTDQVGKVMGMSSRRVGTGQSLVSLGLDSLMAVELRGRVRVDTGVDIPSQQFLDGSNISDIGKHILLQLAPAATPHPAPAVEDQEFEEITL
jgi:acyl carrier protein